MKRLFTTLTQVHNAGDAWRFIFQATWDCGWRLLTHDSEDTMIEDLFDLIGGRSTIEAATELFYEKVLQDDNLRLFFKGVDMAHLRSRQAMFISMLLAGGVYTGKTILDAHARSRDQGLNEAHFDLFLKHFRAALEEVGVKSENAEKIRKRLENKRGAVLDK